MFAGTVEDITSSLMFSFSKGSVWPVWIGSELFFLQLIIIVVATNKIAILNQNIIV